MKIERPTYIQQLINSKDNGLIKIVTGLMWPNNPVVMPAFQYPGMLSADMPEKVFPKKSPPPKFDF